MVLDGTPKAGEPHCRGAPAVSAQKQPQASAPTVLEPKTPTPDTTKRRAVAATAWSLWFAEQHATSYTTVWDVIQT